MIKDDLSDEIFNYKDFLEIKEIAVEQSQTEEESYTAEISVEAFSEYASFQLNANVFYAKYDQGWQMEDCEWEYLSHQVENYPNEEEMQFLYDTRKEELSGDRGASVLLYPEYGDVSTLDDSIFSEGKLSEQVNDYITFEGKVTSYWQYNAETNGWDFDYDEVAGSSRLTTSVEGEWPQCDICNLGYEDGYIKVSNQTDTGIDICGESSFFSEGPVHFEKYTNEENLSAVYYQMEDGISIVKFYENNGFRIKFFENPKDHYFGPTEDAMIDGDVNEWIELSEADDTQERKYYLVEE